MAKLSISFPDDLEQRFEAFAKKEGKTLSASIAEAMEARLAQNGGSASPQNAPRRFFGLWSGTNAGQFATSAASVAAAMIDRLLHHSHIIAINGDSYRTKDKLPAAKKSVRSSIPKPSDGN